MAYYDRDYYRDPAAAGPLTRLRLWSFTAWLIILNVAVFVIDGLVGRAMGYQVMVEGGPLTEWGHFSATTAIHGGQAWRFITFQFLHGGIGHLFFNMMALFFFGPLVESHLGSRRYVVFYLLGGIAGTLGYLILWWTGLVMSDSSARLVGASAGVFAVLAGGATIAPHMKVQLIFPPVSLSLRTLALVMIGIGVFVVLAYGHQPGANAGGEAAHLGGALVGWLLIRHANWLNFADGRFIKKVSPRTIKDRVKRGAFERKLERQRDEAAEVDRILDKVHREGIHSLTRAEKKALERASEKQKKG